MLMMNRRVPFFLMRRRDSFFKADADADAEDAHVTDAVAMLMMQKRGSKGDLFLIVQLRRTELWCSQSPDLGADDDKPDQNCTSTSC